MRVVDSGSGGGSGIAYFLFLGCPVTCVLCVRCSTTICGGHYACHGRFRTLSYVGTTTAGQ
jgi:hypothetical protein